MLCVQSKSTFVGVSNKGVIQREATLPDFGPRFTLVIDVVDHFDVLLGQTTSL